MRDEKMRRSLGVGMGEWASWKMRRDFIQHGCIPSEKVTSSSQWNEILESFLSLAPTSTADFNRIHCRKTLTLILSLPSHPIAPTSHPIAPTSHPIAPSLGPIVRALLTRARVKKGTPVSRRIQRRKIVSSKKPLRLGRNNWGNNRAPLSAEMDDSCD